MDVRAHIEKFLGQPDRVLQEAIHDEKKLDLFFFKPSENFPFYILVTSGISQQPMNTPKGMEKFRYAELCVLLPENWELSPLALEDEKNAWPVSWLKRLADLPRQQNSWLGEGHTIPNGKDPQPLADNTKFCGILLLRSISLPADFSPMEVDNSEQVHFYCLYPLYKEEMAFKLNKGTEELMGRMDELGVLNDVVNIHRENACARLDDDE